MGEDYLDFAIVNSKTRQIRLARVVLRQNDITIAKLAELITNILGDDGAQAVAVVDSPRWPRDLDGSFQGVRKREEAVRRRHIDAALHALTAYLGTRETFHHMRRLSMFPTPSLAYFMRCLGDGCKPHLRTLGRELFQETGVDSPPVRGGAIFTRFMLAGFAAYRALETSHVDVFEGYPDLQFRLLSAALAPKKHALDALAARQAIVTNLTIAHNINGVDTIRTLDQADAAILALSAFASRGMACLSVSKIGMRAALD
ncbi:MAG: hypothetical protein ACREQ4_02330 [Candidatus Binataceae bacterium]